MYFGHFRLTFEFPERESLVIAKIDSFGLYEKVCFDRTN